MNLRYSGKKVVSKYFMLDQFQTDLVSVPEQDREFLAWLDNRAEKGWQLIDTEDRKHSPKTDDPDDPSNVTGYSFYQNCLFRQAPLP